MVRDIKLTPMDDVINLGQEIRCSARGNPKPTITFDPETASGKNVFQVHLTLKVLNFWKFTSYCSLKPLWSGMGGSSASSYLADPTSPIPSHCASIVVTSTLRLKFWLQASQYQDCDADLNFIIYTQWVSWSSSKCTNMVLYDIGTCILCFRKREIIFMDDCISA